MTTRSPARPDVNAARARLLRAGLAIARRSGLRAVTVRGVAARAKVNLGSFVHHFGTREAFLAELVEQWYAPLLGRLESTRHDDLAPLLRLRALLLQIVRWLIANASFMAHLIQDAAHGEVAARRFLRKMPDRPPVLVLAAIQEAQDAGELRREDPAHVLLFLISSLGMPALLFSGLGLIRLLPREFARRVLLFAVDEKQIERRLDWILRGLKP